MASLQKAYLATIQRFRDYYETADNYQLALRPISSIDTPLIEYITVEEWEDGIEEYLNKYLVASLSNEIIQQPHKYMELGQMVWDVYEESLLVSETTSALASRYNDAKAKLDVDSATVPGEGLRYKRTSLSEPTWQEEVIGAEEFDGLINKAQQDAAFMNAFNTTYGLDEDLNAEVTMIRFKKAEVRIIRPWLDTIFLYNRNWRLQQNQTIAGDKSYLSNNESGKEFDGAMPAYPEKFILIKDVEMVFQLPSAEGDDDASQLMEDGHIINFGPILLNQMMKVPSKNIYKAKGLYTNMAFNRLIQADLFNNVQTEAVNPPSSPSVRPSMGNLTINTQPITASGLNITRPTNTQNINLQAFTQPIQLNIHQANPHSNASYYQSLINRPTTFKLNMATLQHVNWQEIINKNKVTIKGQIKGKNNSPLVNAEVLVRHPLDNGKTSVQKVNTDHSGRFELKVTKGVIFNITASQEAHVTKTKSGINANKNVVTANLQLQSKPTQVEKKSDIQLLAVVYRKLGKVPNPVPDFVPVSEDF